MKIDTICFKNFDEFFTQTIPTGELGKELSGFVFRGHSVSRYELLPSALRKENKERLMAYLNVPAGQEEYEVHQRMAELSLLEEFYRLANFNGLKLPNNNHVTFDRRDEYDLFNALKQAAYHRSFADQYKAITELTALAQHYGTITRMLDWTHDLYVAVYFASHGALKKLSEPDFNIDENKHMVIWAINFKRITNQSSAIYRIPINFVVPSYHDNPNLNAQKGLLAYRDFDIIDTPMSNAPWPDWNPGRYTTPINRTPWDTLLEKCRCSSTEKFTVLYRFEIPILECINAFEVINKMNYTTAALFPGYASVTKQMNDAFLAKKIYETCR